MSQALLYGARHYETISIPRYLHCNRPSYRLFWIPDVQRFNLYEILPFKCVLLIEQLIIPLFPFIFGALLGRNWKYLSLSRWHIILNIVLLIVLLPLGFTELTVAIWGAPSFLGSLAKIAGTSGTRILFLVLTGLLLVD